jgi:hypothetical protein
VTPLLLRPRTIRYASPTSNRRGFVMWVAIGIGVVVLTIFGLGMLWAACALAGESDRQMGLK